MRRKETRLRPRRAPRSIEACCRIAEELREARLAIGKARRK